MDFRIYLRFRIRMENGGWVAFKVSTAESRRINLIIINN